MRKKLKQITNKFDCSQIVSGSTRIRTSTRTQIDLIFINRPDRILKSFNMLTVLCDHSLTLVARKLSNAFILVLEKMRIL